MKDLAYITGNSKESDNGTRAIEALTADTYGTMLLCRFLRSLVFYVYMY